MADTRTPRRPKWTLTDRMVKARHVAGFSQDDLADRLGVSRATVKRAESTGNAKPYLLVAWAYVCGVEVDWLTDDDEDGHADTDALTHRDTFACAA